MASLLVAALAVTGPTIAATSAVATSGSPETAPAAAGSPEEGLQAFADLPVSFVENKGQLDHDVRYHAEGSGHAFYFTPDRLVLSFTDDPQTGFALALEFVGADPGVEPVGRGPAAGRVNYLRGDDPARWQTDLRTFSRVVYPGLWPGIDMVFRGDDGQLKYEFLVRPGAQVSDIRLGYAGIDGLSLDASGGLLVDTAGGTLPDSAPVSYQYVDGVQVPVDSRFLLGKGHDYGFQVGDYDRARNLVIDPALDYSTFLGGASMDRAHDLAVDANGNVVVVGVTQSTDFPTTVGALSETFNGGIMDAFVAKLNADGSGLVYATYLGGSPTPNRRGDVDHTELARAVALDGNGNAYIVGQTSAGDFPTTSGAFQTALKVGDNQAMDGFVTKLAPTGGLVYSTLLGGELGSDDARAVAVDSSGNAYVGGSTFAGDFPTTAGAFDRVQHGGEDVFVAKLNGTGSSLVYSTLLGGADNELLDGIAIDAAGSAYVSGSTRSVEFPTTTGSFQPTHSGGGFADLFEVFVTKLNATGTGLAYSTFLGGTRVDRGGQLALDSAGNAQVVVGTESPEFPTTPGAYDAVFTGTSEGALVKLNATGSGLVYSTFLNGGAASSVTLDGNNNTWLGGGRAAGSPVTADGQGNCGSGDVYIMQLDESGSQLLFATYFGGSDSDSGAVELDSAGNIYVAGTTLSADFPTTTGAFDRTWAGDTSIFWGDAFVTKLRAGAGTVGPGCAADTIAPTVTITSPAAGALVSGTVPVTATASDDVGVTEVRFFVDGTLIGTDTTSPYEISWDTTTVANGNHELTAEAADAAGNVGPTSGGTISVENTSEPPGDTTSPTVSITSPQSGTTVSGTVSVTASASDDVAVSEVRFLADGTLIGTDTSSPYEISWDTTTVANGSHELTAQAVDAAGNTGSSAGATVTVDNAAASVTTTLTGSIDKNQTLTRTVSMGAGAVQWTLNWDESRVDLDVRGRDPQGSVIFFDSSSARPKSGSFTAAAAGDYSFQLISNTDRRTNYTLTVTHPSVSSTPPPGDTTAPTVSLTSPASGATVTGTVAVAASASDDVGVTEVRFFVDGTLLGSDTTAPYELSWDTTTVANGAHELTARALDAAGNTGTSAVVSVTVDNAASTGPVTTTLTGRIDKNQTLTRTITSGAGAVEWHLDWVESRVDLDLRVRDPQGNVVAFDGGSARPKTGSFIGATAGDYTFQLINNINRRTNYTLTVTHPAG